MSYYQKGVYQKLYELRVTKTNGETFGCGGLSPEQLAQYSKNAKTKGWKYEVIEESTQARVLV